MNIWSKSLLFTTLLATIAIQGSEVELKEDAADRQQALDVQLYDAVACADTKNVEQLLTQKANPNCDFPNTTLDHPIYWRYIWANRPLVRIVCNLALCIESPITGDITEDALKEQTASCLTLLRVLLEHKANPNVTMSSGTESRSFEKHLAFVYKSKNISAPKIAPAYEALELLLAHGATTDLDSFTFPHGIHGLAEDVPELQRILKEYAAKIRAEIASATPLSPDTTGVVVQYLV